MQRLIQVMILLIAIALTHSEKGIVFSMGPSESHFMGVYATSKSIRSMSNISIEVWCYRFEFVQISQNIKKTLEKIEKVSFKILPDPPILYAHEHTLTNLKAAQKGRSWKTDYLHFASKPLALLTTNFTEVLLLDSDTVLFVPPEDLFALSFYRTTGTLFLRDKFLDYWPYQIRPNDWMQRFLVDFNRQPFETIPLSSADSIPVPSLDIDETKKLSKKFLQSCMYSGSAVKSFHIAESSVVLFDKKRQLRATAVLRMLTTSIFNDVYSHVYGDKETYWMACEIAGADYSFSDYGASHWASMTRNQTCPDLVIDPTFAHYLPQKVERIMSMNQVKLRHLQKFFGRNRKKNLVRFAVSKRQLYDDQLRDYIEAERMCNPSIKPLRRFQRCWSSKVTCSSLPSDDWRLLVAHVQYQIEAQKIVQEQSIQSM